MPFFDSHIHLRPDGQGVEAAKVFKRAGGTHLLLTHSPYHDVPIDSEKDYDKSYLRTLEMADAVRKLTDLNVFCALGPYPVDLIYLKKRHGTEKGLEIMMGALEIAGRHVREGRAIAIGEIGRPHFPTADDVREASNKILAYGLTIAKECGCAAVIHAEDPDSKIFEEFARLCDDVGIRRDKVVKHHSTPLVRVSENYGIFPSLLAREDVLLKAIQAGNRFLMETDFIDDPRRPGAVLGPATVPKKTKMLRDKGILSEEDVFKIHKDNPEKVYGITVD